MIEILLMILVLIPSVVTSVITRVDEAHHKHEIRKETGIADYPLLGSMSIMPMATFLLTIPFIYFIDFDIANIVVILTVLSVARFIPWSIMVTLIGKYSDAMHQGSSNFTMYENFAGPIGGLLTFSIYNYSQNTDINLMWYLLTPMMGIFLVWAMREKEDKKLGRELIVILATFAIMVSIESAILLYCLNEIPKYIENPILVDFEYINDGIFYFFVVIAISSLMASTYFMKQLKRDIGNGYFKIVTKLGVINGVSDLFYFVGFTLFGPIFLLARRGLIIPIQNLYLALKDGSKILKTVLSPLNTPLMSLRGGKDFIISFVDMIFNNVVKFIIKILG